MISNTLYFSSTIVFCTGMKTKEYSFLKSSILVQKKIGREGGARFLAFSIYLRNKVKVTDENIIILSSYMIFCEMSY